MNASRQERLTLALCLADLEAELAEDDILIHHMEMRKRRRRKKRRWWVRPWVVRRPLLGQYTQLMRELEIEDEASFKNFMRVEPAMFHELVERLAPRIEKVVTRMRRPLEPGLKVALTLRYLASGNSLV